MNLEIIEQFEEFDELQEVQLDKMVDVSFSQQILKQNFELIIKVLRGHRLSVTKLSDSFKDLQNLIPSLSLIDELKENIEKHEDRITLLEGNQENKGNFTELEQKYKNLESDYNKMLQKQQEYDEMIKQLQDKDDKQQIELDKLTEQFSDLQEKQRLLNEMKSKDGGNVSPEMLIDLQTQLTKLRSNLHELEEKCSNYLQQSQLEPIEANLSKLEEQIKQLTNELHEKYTPVSQFQDLAESTDELAKEFKQLRDQYLVDKFSEIDSNTETTNDQISDLKLQIQQLYELINTINSNSEGKQIQVPVIQPPSIDPSKLKQLENQIKKIESQNNELQTKIHQNSDLIQRVKEQTKQSIDQLQEEKMDKKENNGQEIAQLLNGLRERVNLLNNSVQNVDLLSKSNADDIKQIFGKLSQKKGSIKEIAQQREPQLNEQQIGELIRDQLDKLQDDLMKLINSLFEELPLKATKEGLQSHEIMMKKIIDEILAQLKTLADKSETKKSFAYLEKKINEIYQLAMQDKKENDCDGLLAKKQLGWSCASCDKELDKYKGQLGDYINWAVFPRKETSPIFALHYANEIAKRAHETAYYKNFEPEQVVKPKTSHSNEFHTQNQMASNYVPSIFRPSNTLYTLKPVNSKIVINTANLQSNAHVKEQRNCSNLHSNMNNSGKTTIHNVHNQLSGVVKNLNIGFKGVKKE